MDVKIAAIALLAIFVAITVEAAPTDKNTGWKALENDDEEFKKRCLILAGLLAAKAAKFASQQQQSVQIPQSAILPPIYSNNNEGIIYVTPEYIQQEMIDVEYIFVDLYENDFGQWVYYLPDANGQSIEYIYPQELFMQTEFRNLENYSKEKKLPLNGRIETRIVMEYEERLKKEKQQAPKPVLIARPVAPQPIRTVQLAPAAQQQRLVVVSGNTPIPQGATTYRIRNRAL